MVGHPLVTAQRERQANLSSIQRLYRIPVSKHTHKANPPSKSRHRKAKMSEVCLCKTAVGEKTYFTNCFISSPIPAQKQHFFPNFLFSLIPRFHTQFNTSTCTAHRSSQHTPEANSPCGRDTPEGRGEESRNTCAQFLSDTLKSEPPG